MPMIITDSINNSCVNNNPASVNKEADDIEIDALEWFDAEEQLSTVNAATSEKEIEQQVPLTEDCLRCIRQLIRQFAELKQHEYLFSALNKLIPGLPVELTLTAQSLYTAIREKKSIDLALLNSLGLISTHLLPDGNLLARLADYLKETIIYYLGEGYLAQFLRQDESHPGSQIFTAIGLLAIVIGYRMNDVAAPRRLPLRLPKFIFHLLLRADCYWNKLCRMAQASAESCVMQSKDTQRYRCVREKLPAQQTPPSVSDRQLWTCSEFPAHTTGYYLKPETRCDRQLSAQALAQMRSAGLFYAAYPLPADPVSDATPAETAAQHAAVMPVLPELPSLPLAAYDPLSLLPAFLPGAAAVPVNYPERAVLSDNALMSNGLPQESHIVIKDKDGEIINLNINKFDLEKGKQAIRNFYDSYASQHPDLKTFASATLKKALKAQFNLDIDPDNSWFMHFNSGSSSDKSFTGWEHNDKPIEAFTLTEMLFTNFAAQDNLISLNSITGLYNSAPDAASKFGASNEIKILPAAFIKLIWDLDFYNLAVQEVQRSFADEKDHIKKYFIDFILAAGMSQLDADAARDVLNGCGLLSDREVKISLLSINGYRASNAFIFENQTSRKLTLYLPGHEIRFIAFNTLFDLRAWIVNNCADREHQAMLAAHFDLKLRQDGILFSGVESWLRYFFNHPDYNEKIGLQDSGIKPDKFFHFFFTRMKERAFIDLDVAIKSDAEVRHDMLEKYVDASNIIPNPFSPFLSLAFHLEHAFNSDTNEERKAEWEKITSDIIDFALLLIMDKMIKFNTEGYDFIYQVKEGMASAKSSEVPLSPDKKRPAGKVAASLGDRLGRIQKQGLGGKGSKQAAKSWAEEEAGPSGIQRAADAPLRREDYIASWQKWLDSAPVWERAARKQTMDRMQECLDASGPCMLSLKYSVVGELSSLPEVLPPVEVLYLHGQAKLEALPENLSEGLKIIVATGCRLKKLPKKLPDSLQKLYVQDNHLQRVPDNLPPGLKTLDISQNRIKYLPATLPDSLITLLAGENQLSVLPKKFPASLKKLVLSYNKIRVLPDELPDSIMMLDISANRLAKLPQRLPKDLIKLYISSNALDALPARLPAGLKILAANDNYLQILPNNLPDQLEEIYLEDNRISELPAKLPSHLKKFILRTNFLSTLPDNLPAGLLALDVSNNFLTAIPHQLPAALELLSLSVNSITFFPASLPARLKILFISNNMLESLPASLPDSIERIYVSFNQLHTLPEHLPALLRLIDARHNQISTLPESIVRAPRHLVVYLDENPLSRRTLETLIAFNNDPHYQGPQIYFSMAQNGFSSPVPPLNEVVADWLSGEQEENQEERWKTIAQEEYAVQFSAFLSRLADTVGAKNAPEFKSQVAVWLKQLAEAAELRKNTFLLAEDATATCEDRVALTYNEMQKAALEHKVASGAYDDNLPDLIFAAREMFRLALLEQVARNKVATLHFVDEIEVYLAYQVKLHQVLKLQTGVAAMRFFDVSWVTEDDLRQATLLVKNRENNEFRTWLAQWAPWKQALKRIDPALYNKAASELQEKLEHDYQQKVNARLAAEKLTGDEDALRIIGKQVMDEMMQESDVALTEAFLQQRKLEQMLEKFWKIN
ncbi:NEL-type E3 ubiquitin ligase domain-containing protein [[Erwinia] mediterraneensis]|uniref:NEL-type E3 ubiquitin ligase domain-containing protein n=1 Tax=[Erwinia] mediterraneensis TaxID=2161819 RepID=UPI00102F7F1F|nr:NEL-type E3 ubiquitin ligase domain-containing protein [[Erwinia] mediterraneensis]